MEKKVILKKSNAWGYDIEQGTDTELDFLAKFLGNEITSELPYWLFLLWISGKFGKETLNITDGNGQVCIQENEFDPQTFSTSAQDMWRIINEWTDITTKKWNDQDGNEIDLPETVSISYHENGYVKIQRLDSYQDAVDELIAHSLLSKIKSYVLMAKVDSGYYSYDFFLRSFTNLDYLAHFLKREIKAFLTYDFFLFWMTGEFGKLLPKLEENDSKILIKFDLEKGDQVPFAASKEELWKIITSWMNIAKRYESNSNGIQFIPAKFICIYYDEEGKVQIMNLDPYPKLLELLLPKVSPKGRK